MAMYARDVGQDGKAAEVGHSRGERRIDGIAIANIHRQEVCRAGALAIRGFYGSDAELFIHVERIYTGSLCEVRLHHRLSNALRAASDDDAFSNEFHVFLKAAARTSRR